MELAATAATPREREKGDFGHEVTRWLDGHGLGVQVPFSQDKEENKLWIGEPWKELESANKPWTVELAKETETANKPWTVELAKETATAKML